MRIRRLPPRVAAAVDEGQSFAYSEEEWSKISECLPCGSDPYPDFRHHLEMTALIYLAALAYGAETERTRNERKRDFRVLKAGRAFLAALEAANYAGIDLVVSGVRKIAERSELSLDGPGGIRVGNVWLKGNHPVQRLRLRRFYVERIIMHWHAAARRKMPDRKIMLDRDEAGKLYDFIEAASRPVLIGEDGFNKGFSGREAIRKIVKKINVEGIEFWDLGESSPAL
jgi:hypothetical protein